MVYLFLAPGFEIIEAMSPVDMLRRAKIEVKTIGVGSKTVVSSNGVPVTADDVIENIDYDDSLDCIILPGGMPGTLNLEASEKLQDIISKANSANKLVCAICAAPSVLGHKNLLVGKKATAFPGFEKDLTGAKVSSDFVVVDGNIVTAKGAGSSIEFGLKIVELLASKETADSIQASIQYYER